MHEMSLCESVLRIIESEAPVQGFSRVTRVCLEIGHLAGVEVEAMRFGFDVVTAGSLAAGARLDIERVRESRAAHRRAGPGAPPAGRRWRWRSASIPVRAAAASRSRSFAATRCGSRNWRWSDV